MSKGRGYTVVIKRSAEKEMDRLPDRAFQRIARAILKLERDPRQRGSKKLRGVEVIAVGHRREVYRGL